MNCETDIFLVTLSHEYTEMEVFMEQFLTDEDLFGLLDELEQEEAESEIIECEMEASNRRYEDIIRKHRTE